jgi:hypothetical protein
MRWFFIIHIAKGITAEILFFDPVISGNPGAIKDYSVLLPFKVSVGNSSSWFGEFILLSGTISIVVLRSIHVHLLKGK